MRVVSTRGGAVSGVRIRLLGPVEVLDDGRVVPLGGPRPRTLLGALALRAPDAVSRDNLVDGVWDADPPPCAGNTLRAHVSYLRKRLAGAGIGELVATRPPGYALAAPAECVDAHRFQELVDMARAEPAAERAAVGLRAALALWRGDALAGCPGGEWIRAEVTRLHEVRLCANEDLLAAELAMGRHAAVVPQLEALVARYPLRERLWELLMRSLYRAGRQGDALQAYRRARSRLVAEIGVEPGVELRRLEAAILAGSAEPGVPAAGPRAAGVPAAGSPAVGGRAAGMSGAVVLVPEPRTSTNDDPAGAGSVPAPLTNLIGRRAEIAELGALLTDRRLVTLTGIGGCGKTRLAIEIAGRQQDPVCFVDLTPLADPDLVPGAVAAVLGLPADPAGGVLAALTEHLRPQRCLLVLDNCEHVVRSGAHLAAALLRSCPLLRVLATSRETLGVLGEVAWPVPPLAVPPLAASSFAAPSPVAVPPVAGSPVAVLPVAVPGPGGALAAVRRYDAVRLFVDRASVATVRGLTDADAPALAALCARLDGLPLAIELAAARTSVLTVAEIAERLHDPALLHAHRHPGRPHHRALDTTIAWSYDLLDAASRSRLRRLAVFAGGFALDAAEAIWPDRAGLATVDLLADLVGKSLVVMERHPAGARYRLLETIGRWAAARLAEHPDEERDARRRHAGHFLAIAERADQRLRHAELGAWLDRLAAEHENLRAALAWFARDGSDPAAQLRLAVALAGYCQLRGRYREGRQWLEQALAGGAACRPETLGRARAAAAKFALLLCDYRHAEVRAEQALAVQRRCGDDAGAASTLRLLASVARERGHYGRALAALDEAATTAGRGGSPDADLLQQIGVTCWLAGDLDRAERVLSDALNRYQRSGDPMNVACTRTCLAAAALYRGELGRAGRMAAAGLARFIELDMKEGIAYALNVIGLVALREGRPRRAIAVLRASLDAHYAIGDRWRQASVLEALAAAVLATGDAIMAAELAGLASALRESLGVPVPAQERADWARTQAALRRVLPADERTAALARGGAMRVPDVLARIGGPGDLATQPAGTELPVGRVAGAPVPTS